MSRTTRILLISCGTLCVLLAGVGLLIPVLPTTPFLLLAAYCYARSSERFYRWLVTNRLFGAYIRNYREGRGMALWHKVATITLVWLSIGAAAALTATPWWLKLILLGIALGVTLHLARIKTTPARPGSRRLAGEPAEPEEST